MSNGTNKVLWKVATTFGASIGAAGDGVLPLITDKGLIPVAIVDGGSGSFGTFYANSENPIATDATSRELGVIGFTFSFDVATAAWTRITSDGNDADGVAAVAAGILNINGFNYVWNGTTWDRVRGAVVYKTVVATALGETTVWDPAGGKKVRLMGYTISVAGTLAATGVQTIQLLNGNAGTVIANHLATVADTPTGDSQMGADWGQGQLLTTDANLRIKLGTAMTTGGVAINAWGVEE